MRLIDRTGEVYGRLRVISRAPNANASDTNARWNCKCECGRMVLAYGQDLKKGKVKSCGCLNAQRIYRHGYSRTAVYNVWKQILQRCENPKSPSYGNYGERGITVDPRWRDFLAFLEDMGEPPAGATIDRRDNSAGYSKENCRWVSYQENLNNKRDNRVLALNGRKQTVTQWAEELGVSREALFGRLRRGWTAERTLTEPLHKGHVRQ